MKKNDLIALLAKEGGSTIEDMTRAVDKYLLNVEESSDETSEEAPEEEETSEETNLEVEEVEEEETEEEAEEEEAEEEEETVEEVAEEEVADTETFMAIMSQLADEIDALREENKQLKAQLAAKATAEAEFAKRFKKLSVSLSREPKVKVEEHKVYTDGIGE